MKCVHRKSANLLIEESGCGLEHPSATKFRQFVMNGDWNKADHYLQELQTMIDRKHSNIVVSMIRLESQSTPEQSNKYNESKCVIPLILCVRENRK